MGIHAVPLCKIKPKGPIVGLFRVQIVGKKAYFVLVI